MPARKYRSDPQWWVRRDVEVSLLLHAECPVQEALVQSSLSHAGLEEAAPETMRGLEFTPALKRGESVPFGLHAACKFGPRP